VPHLSDTDAPRSAVTRTSRPARPAFPLGTIVRRVLVWMGALWLVVGALLAPVVPGGWAGVAALAILAALPIVALVRGLSGRAYPTAAVRLLVLRPFWYAQLLLPLLAGAGLAGAIGGLPFGASGPAGRWAMLVVATIFAIGAIAGYAGSRRLVVRRLDARLDGLPDALDGLRIAQLSDLHVGPQTPGRHLARIADAVQRAGAELIVITGDQVDDFAPDVAYFARAFASLSAPLGVHAIAGNHDVYAGWDGVRVGLERMGARVLVNEAVRLDHDGASLWLAGTGDPAGRGGPAAPDVERALDGIPPGSVAVVLAHNPALWPAIVRGAARRALRTVTLSGHTHHGQLSIPRLGWSLASPFLEHAMGAHLDGDALLYINPGTNYWGIPFRIGALPEVTVLTLRRTANGQANGIVPTGEGERPDRCRPMAWRARRTAA
jgi:uncharacterized protein